jgi:hypothetical protein
VTPRLCDSDHLQVQAVSSSHFVWSMNTKATLIYATPRGSHIDTVCSVHCVGWCGVQDTVWCGVQDTVWCGVVYKIQGGVVYKIQCGVVYKIQCGVVYKIQCGVVYKIPLDHINHGRCIHITDKI